MIEGWDKYGPVNANPTTVAALMTAGEWTSTSGTISHVIVAGLSSPGTALSMTTNANALNKTLGGSYSRLIGGFRFASNLAAIVGMAFTDTATNQCGININTTGTISVRNGTWNTGTVLGTSATSVSANSTHYLEFDITFNNSGSYQIWLDGVSVLSGSGDTTATANAYANVISFNTGAGTVNYTVDDFYLFDTSGSTQNAVLLNSPRIETTFPTSDSAVQFAVGAAILGSSVLRSSVASAATAAFLYLRRFTPAVAGTINSITLMPAATSAGANFRGVIYADSGGAAGTLMSSGTQVTGVTNGTAVTLPLTTPQSLAAGTQYWLGFINDTTVNMALTDNNNSGYRVANTYASGAPSTAPALTSGQATIHLWGNLTGVTANWPEVSQQPPAGATAYVFDATVNHEDLYGFNPLSTMPGTVHAVAVKGYVQRSDAGAKTVSLRTKSGSTDSGGSSTGQAPATTFGWLTSYFLTDPNTSAAWTGTNLDAATSGFKVDS